MEGAGRAAGEAYAWAIQNPDKVMCVYAENPVLESLMSKTPLLEGSRATGQAGVPLIHVCGSLDPHLDDQTRKVEKRYKELGGPVHRDHQRRRGTFFTRTERPVAAVELLIDEVKLIQSPDRADRRVSAQSYASAIAARKFASTARLLRLSEPALESTGESSAHAALTSGNPAHLPRSFPMRSKSLLITFSIALGRHQPQSGRQR